MGVSSVFRFSCAERAIGGQIAEKEQWGTCITEFEQEALQGALRAPPAQRIARFALWTSRIRLSHLPMAGIAMDDGRWKLWFDGACEPSNPGPMSIGALLISPEGTCFEFGDRIGLGTSNVAEYRALIRGLEEAAARGATRIDVRGDSQLVIRQLTGEYRLKSQDMRAEFNRAMALLRQIGNWNTFWIPRENNARADALSKRHLQLLVDPKVSEGAKSVVVEKVAGHIWSARGRAGKGYAVDLVAGVCSCPDFARRRKICVHLLAAQHAEGMVA